MLAGASGAQAQPAVVPAGSYSSLVTDPETGWREGLRLDIRAAGWVEVTLCEGACRKLVSGPIAYEGGRLSFEVDEIYVVLGSHREFRPRYRFEGRYEAGRIILDSSDRPGFEPQVLRALR